MAGKNNKRSGRRIRKGRQNGTAGYQLVNTNKYTSVHKSRFTFLDPHMYITLRYTQVTTFTNLTTVGSAQIFNLNSVFDPDRTGGGHQPYGFDQIAVLYNRYRVLKTHWKVTFGPTTNSPVGCVVVPTNGLLAAAITNIATFESSAEIPFAWSSMVPNAGSIQTHSGSMALNELNGCTRNEYLADDRFESQVASSPTELMVLTVGIVNTSTVTVVNTVIVTLEFEVDFHDPIINANSFYSQQQQQNGNPILTQQNPPAYQCVGQVYRVPDVVKTRPRGL